MYREYGVAGRWLADALCLWTSITDHARVPTAIVPDGCIDLLWSSTSGLVVVGPMTEPVVARFPHGTQHVGLRLRPGHAPRVVGMPARLLTDRTEPASDVLGAVGRRLSERLDAATTTADRLRVMGALPELRPTSAPDATALAALGWLAAHPGDRVEVAAARVGLSPRQLQRRVADAVGYGPKRFQRVVRVQRVLALGPSALGRLATVAAELGFADQAHLAREVGEFTGRSPVRALLDGRATLHV